MLSFNLKDLTLSNGTISESYIDDLSVFWEFDIVKNDKRTLNIKNCSIVNSWGNVVVGCNGVDLSFMETHFLFLIL